MPRSTFPPEACGVLIAARCTSLCCSTSAMTRRFQLSLTNSQISPLPYGPTKQKNRECSWDQRAVGRRRQNAIASPGQGLQHRASILRTMVHAMAKDVEPSHPVSSPCRHHASIVHKRPPRSIEQWGTCSLDPQKPLKPSSPTDPGISCLSASRVTSAAKFLWS